MASVDPPKKRGGKYKVRWRNPDGQACAKRCPDAATADKLRLEIERCLALGQPYPPPRTGPVDVDEVMRQWLTALYRRLRASTLRVRIDQLEVWRRFVTSYQGTVWSRQMLAEYLDWLRQGTGRHGRPRKLSTALRLVEVVEQLWAWAYDWRDEMGWGEAIPQAKRVTPDIPRPVARDRPQPSWAQMAACVAAADGWLRDLLTVLYYTPLRVQQALMLLRSDVDLDQRMLRIRPELGKTAQESSGRTIPICEAFAAWIAAQPPVEGGWLVPCSRKQRKPRDRDASRAWERSGAPAEVWEGRPHHCFRAGHMTGLRALGARWESVEWLAGHAPTPTSGSYLDPHQALGLRDVVALIPTLQPKESP